MALSTIKITDTMEWAKKFSFGRNSGLGNSLQPALANANMVMQTVLGPPFGWWWNNEDLLFTCDANLKTAPLTNVVVAASIATISAVNTFFAGQEVIFGTVTGTASAFLSGKIFEIISATGASFTIAVSVTTYGTAANTGTITAATNQDYIVAAPEFSHIDYAAIQDINQTPAKWYELKEQDHLSLDSIRKRPEFINPQSQDASGNMTFRLMSPPDKAYPVVINAMKAAPVLTSLNSTWAPIPDFMQYIVNWGFLSLTWAFADDPRFGMANQKFTAGLLARATGLSEQERNIFLNNWDQMTGMAGANAQQGRVARAT